MLVVASKNGIVGIGEAMRVLKAGGSVLDAVEVGIQPILHVGLDGRPLYSPFPIQITLPGIMVQHLAIFSFIEVAVTVLAMIYFQRAHPELVMGTAPLSRE
jgi:cobalt/nickel transport system permease protein